MQMDRRRFLVGTAAGVGAVAGLARLQAQAGPAPAAAQGRAGGPGRGGGPAQVAPEKLARVSIMTLCFDNEFKTPWTANPTPQQTMTIFDLPKLYVDSYGVRNIEFQHSHLGAMLRPRGDPPCHARLDGRGQMTINLSLAIKHLRQRQAAEASFDEGRQRRARPDTGDAEQPLAHTMPPEADGRLAGQRQGVGRNTEGRHRRDGSQTAKPWTSALGANQARHCTRRGAKSVRSVASLGGPTH
jgi:hypothetical protein